MPGPFQAIVTFIYNTDELIYFSRKGTAKLMAIIKITPKL